MRAYSSQIEREQARLSRIMVMLRRIQVVGEALVRRDCIRIRRTDASETFPARHSLFKTQDTLRRCTVCMLGTSSPLLNRPRDGGKSSSFGDHSDGRSRQYQRLPVARLQRREQCPSRTNSLHLKTIGNDNAVEAESAPQQAIDDLWRKCRGNGTRAGDSRHRRRGRS